MRIPKTLSLTLGLLVAAPGLSQAAEVVIGVPSWSSAEATAHVLKSAIEREFGVAVALERGSNEDIFSGMDTGSIHVHPEVWLPNHESLSTEYVVRRKSVEMSSRGIPARQGLCVTRHTRDQYDIHSVADLSDPGKARVFDTAGDGLGEIWIGAPDWTSTRIERIRAHSYGYAETMQLIEAEEVLATVAIDAAVAVDKPLVFYCYEPHHVFELHDIVHLDEPPHDPRSWRIVDPGANADWLAMSNADVAWPVSFFHIHYATELTEAHPDISAFLAAVQLDVDTVSQMTYALVVERRDPESFAAEWLDENEERVEGWLAASRRGRQ